MGATAARAAVAVAPGLRVGRGLEHHVRGRYVRPQGLRPAFGSGEDWNGTLNDERVARDLLRPAFGSGEDWNEGVPVRES